MNRMASRDSGRWLRRTVGVAATVVVLALSGCGGEDTDATSAAEEAVDKVAGSSKAELKGNSPLDAAAYGITRVMSQKFADYEIDGDTVRLIARDGAELSGSECTIVNAATQADHPDVTFVVVNGDGEESPC